MRMARLGVLLQSKLMRAGGAETGAAELDGAPSGAAGALVLRWLRMASWCCYYWASRRMLGVLRLAWPNRWHCR